MWRIGLGMLLSSFALADADIPLYLMEVPPYTINRPEQRGMVGDVVLEAMRRAGLREKLLVEPSPRAMARVQVGTNLLIMPLARIPERESDYTWIEPVARFERAFFSLDRKAQSFAEAREHFRRVAVSRGTAGYHILLAQGFDRSQLVEVNQGITAPRMLLARRVDAWYNPVLEARALLRQLNNPALQMGTELGSTDNYLACSKSCDPQLVEKLGTALKQMRDDGSTRRIAKRYATD